MSVHSKISELKQQLEIIECYEDLLRSDSYLPANIKRKYQKTGAYDECMEQVKDFISSKIESIEQKNEEVKKEETPEPVIQTISQFTEEEVRVLKSLAHKVLGQQQKPVEASVSPSEKPIQRSSPRPTGQPKQSLKSKILRNRAKIEESYSDKITETEEEIAEMSSFQSFVGKTTRTTDHTSLSFIGKPPKNDLAPFSTVKILEINDADKKAKIQFVGDEEATATINLNELKGFEYVEE